MNILQISRCICTLLRLQIKLFVKKDYGVGALSVAILFNVVSIPLMEKRQLARRADYAQYKTETSRLLILPYKLRNDQDK